MTNLRGNGSELVANSTVCHVYCVFYFIYMMNFRSSSTHSVQSSAFFVH